MFKNIDEVEKLKSELNKIADNHLNYEDFTVQLTLSAIDNILTKLKELENLVSQWKNKIKPSRLKVLKNELNYLHNQIEESKEKIEKNNEMLNLPILADISPESPTNLYYFYTNINNLTIAYMKILDKLYKRFEQVSSEYENLKNDNNFYIFDEKGKLIDKKIDLDSYYEKIQLHIRANLQVQISKEQLKKIILENEQSKNIAEVEDNDDF
ncbi:hypothetical protein [Mesomycoplasma lagogenitalium]|uniref:Uncharacterized protein n=1 Tax=Mesomycoplasma lagogenitalium TaxID=171286 RepID=A0ABY8LTC6_9BACT|nr:hypothetical protein [Mesomycoplasma lagogenitalium]WGI36490.1 hypothetical protein QEG99_03430 [Mesomycoplasma lagogenitalium]